MTALCGGGSSQPLPLVEPTINLTSASAAFLATMWGFPELAPVIAVACGALDFAAVAYCANDPPPDPGLTQQDVVDAMAIMDPVRALPAQARVAQWFQNRYWWEICQCSGVQTPLPPAMSNPNTSIGIGPGAPSGVTGGPCWTGSGSFNVAISQMFGKNFVEPWLPNGSGSRIALPGVNSPYVCIPPPGTKSISWSIQHVASSKSHDIAFNEFTPSGTNTQTHQMASSTIVGVQSGTLAYDSSGTAPYCAILVESNPGFQGDWSVNWTGEFSFQCADSPPNTIVQPCCPPDPLVDLKLTQILSLVMNLYNRGGTGLNGYRLGRVFGPFFDTGEFQTEGAVGVLVQIVAKPPTKQQPGNPPYIWDMGWLSCSTPDGFIDEKRLTRDTQIWMSPLAPLANKFAWFLFPEVEVVITELLPA